MLRGALSTRMRSKRTYPPPFPVLWLAAGGLASISLADATASASPPELLTETAAQFYDVRSPSGQSVLARRRLMTTLGVGVNDLLVADRSANPNGATLSFRARLRYDADYGGTAGETDQANAGSVIPGFERGPVDIMYGYVEGRRFLGGWLGFKVGRQYVVDALGWWSFDGGQIKITTPYYVAAEVYGGLEQRSGMPLSTPRYERDGVWRGDRTGYDPSLYPSFQPSDVAPAYGAALESAGSTWWHARLAYRRVDTTGPSNVSSFANGTRAAASYDRTRLSQERIGVGIDATFGEFGGLKAGVAYDGYRGHVANAFASLDTYVSTALTVSLDYEYDVPTFDADSIWNFFLAMPLNDLGLRANWDATSRFSLSTSARARAFAVQTANESANQAPNNNDLSKANFFPKSSLDVMGGANASARYRFGDGAFGARGSADFASTGQRLGLDIYGERTLESRYVVNARAGIWQWDDQQRLDRDAVSFQYVAGAGYKVAPRSLLFVDFEHDINRLVGHRFRGMLWLSLAVTK